MTSEAQRGHPKGLYLLFTVEMWERMSYYGMRALLVLYMIAKTDADNAGFGFTQSTALQVYAWYTGLVYATPLLGGFLADRFIGQRRSVYIGGWLMMIGHFLMAVPGTAVFFAALGFLIVGNGFFKPNISTMVGGLYAEGDSRRDSAFTIFYMGINLGAFLASAVCGTLGEKLGYHWGFASAGVGMALGLLIFWRGERRILPDGIGEKPEKKSAADKVVEHKPLTKIEIDRIAVILVLSIFVMFFWAAFEQAGGLMNIYTKEKVDRFIGGFEVPASWFQAVNPFMIFLFAPFFSWVWGFLSRRNLDPPTPIKMAFGLILLSFGFIFMLHAVNQADAGSSGLAAMYWVVAAYFWHTMGELCLSPIGLSMVTKLAPARLASLLMGAWFGSNFLANLAAGYIGGYSERLGEFELFSAIILGTSSAGMALFVASRKLVAMMHLPTEGKSWSWLMVLSATTVCGLLFFGYPHLKAGERKSALFECSAGQREARANLYRLRDLQRGYFNEKLDAGESKRRERFTTDLNTLGFCPQPEGIEFAQRELINVLENVYKQAGKFESADAVHIQAEYNLDYSKTPEGWHLVARAKHAAQEGAVPDTWEIDQRGCALNTSGMEYNYEILEADSQGFRARARRRPEAGGIPSDTFVFMDDKSNFSIGSIVTNLSLGTLENTSGGCAQHMPLDPTKASQQIAVPELKGDSGAYAAGDGLTSDNDDGAPGAVSDTEHASDDVATDTDDGIPSAVDGAASDADHAVPAH